ncbi:MAG: bifunctional [glutamate--ammonia ligase]-adenylyl-L-tyrosine phosphorylase/[glutamate--ammonia-ligase] adenylyltransferase [Desulfomonilaceae bacterium]
MDHVIPTKTAPLLEDLLTRLSAESGQEHEALVSALLGTPNPATTASRIDDLLKTSVSPLVEQILRRPDRREPFLKAIGGSGFLYATIMRRLEFIEQFFWRGEYCTQKKRADFERELAEEIGHTSDCQELKRILRAYKEREYLRIGTRDLADMASVRETMAELSDLASACVAASLAFHYERLCETYGYPAECSPNKGVVVLGLGKISGGELNFSSDIDLLFLRGPEEGVTNGPKVISVKLFFEELVKNVARSLSEITQDGFVFRVDLRLRPEGEKGELVPSVNNALDYYLSWGRTWERAALMKARVIAGDLELGEEFLQELEPFIYRKHLDYSTIEEMRAMKSMVERSLRKKPGVNIKLGQGGIREIEFFVQTLQLINAGKMRRLRSTSTYEALQLLAEAGVLDRKTAELLADAYLFFRKTEHRIQIDHQLQTHELPRTPGQQTELARRMGYKENALEQFLSDLESKRKIVEDLFASMFHHSDEEIQSQLSPLAKRIAEEADHHAALIELVKEAGFQEPEESSQLVHQLLRPAERRGFSEKSKRILERLAPLFLDEILETPEPTSTLRALDRYIDSLHSSASYFSTFLENITTARFLVRILGESLFFSDMLIRHPQIIDSLIGKSTYEGLSDKRQFQDELAERLDHCEDYESQLDVLRRYKHEQLLAIGVKQLWGEVDSAAARACITDLAEACLGAAVEIAHKAIAKKFGGGQGDLPFAVLGMGKLGGKEMTYLSDLDIVFVYEDHSERRGSLYVHDWFSRLAARVISALATHTAEGKAFEIDTRLRPSGNKGPLVSSLNSFRDYHKDASKLWEKQALIKARPIVGPQCLKDELAGIIKDCLIRAAASDEDLKEIAHLRERMEQEIAEEDKRHVDLKTGQGGLVDVEFFVQGHLLKYAAQKPELLRQNTLEALAALHEHALIDAETFTTLDKGYRFLINLEDHLRLMEHRIVDRIPLTSQKIKGLARRLGYTEQGGERLLEDYFSITKAIREIYLRFFGKR